MKLMSTAVERRVLAVQTRCSVIPTLTAAVRRVSAMFVLAVATAARMELRAELTVVLPVRWAAPTVLAAIALRTAQANAVRLESAKRPLQM